MKNAIIKELTNKGYNVEATTVLKNNVSMEGLIIGTGTIRPTIYTDEIIKSSATVDEAVDKIISIYEEHKTPDIDYSCITDRYYILEHLTIGFQRTTDEDIIKKPTEYAGIEQYLMVNDTQQGFSYKVKESLLDNACIDTEYAWDKALETVKATATSVPLKTKIIEMGMPEFLVPDLPIVYVSNYSGFKGASAVLNKELLQNIAVTYRANKLYIIPSSIHECLVVIPEDNYTLEMLTDMVREVNSEEVEPIEQLSDEAYIIEF